MASKAKKAGRAHKIQVRIKKPKLGKAPTMKTKKPKAVY